MTSRNRPAVLARIVSAALAALALSAGPSAAQPTDEVVYYHADAIGSVRMVTDATGQVVARYDYLPFGEPWRAEWPATNTVRFAGKALDSETDFEYFGARYYASQTGRFTSVDPVLDQQKALLDPQRWNRYAYALNNPLRNIDPDGKEPVTVGLVLWGLYEVGSTLYDAYTTYRTLNDPNASAAERSITTGGLLAGILLPGGGYGTGGRALFRSSLELGHHIESIGLKVENILTKNLNAATIQAAVRELRGEVVAINPRTGAPFNHVDKVMQAARGLEKQADEIKRLLSSGDLTRKARSVLEFQLRRTRETLSELEAYGLVP